MPEIVIVMRRASAHKGLLFIKRARALERGASVRRGVYVKLPGSLSTLPLLRTRLCDGVSAMAPVIERYPKKH